MRIAVTGASGAFGQTIAPVLQSELAAEVVLIDVAPAGRTVINADVRDTSRMTQLLAGCEVVLHAAAAMPSRPAQEIRSVDVEGTRSVLEAASRAGVARIVHLSSTAVYGLPDVVPTPESYPMQGVDAYSRAKGAAERHCQQVRERFAGLTVLRPKTFLGPGRLGLFAMLFEWAAEGRDFPVLGSGRQRAQMLHVQDLCDAVIAVLSRSASAVWGPYNVGAARFGSIESDFQAVLDAAGRGGRVRHLPTVPAVVALRAAAAVGRSPVYPRLVHKLAVDSFVDISAAERELGFRPRYSNAELLVDTFDWWRFSPAARSASAGVTHTQPWKQGVLALAKPLFT